MTVRRTDSFTAGAGPLDSTWTQQRTTQTVNYNGSGSAVASTTDQDIHAFDNSIAYGNDQYSKITIGVVASGDAYVFAVTRANGVGDANYNNYFVLSDGGSGAGHTELWKTTAGVEALLRSYATTFTAGDVLELRSIGNVHEAFKNGVSLGTFTDSAHASGAAGVGLFNSSGGGAGIPAITDFEGGDFAGAPVGFGGSKRPPGARGPRDRRGFLKARVWSYDILAVVVSGASVVNGGGGVTAGGFKSSGGVAVVSASSAAVSSGSKASSGAAVVSSSSRVTAAASKGASNIAVIKAGGRVVTVSIKNGAASAIVSCAGSGSAIGFKGALNTARSSTSSRVFAIGTQVAPSARFAIVSSSSRVTALGIKGAAAGAVVSASSRTTSTGQKAAFSLAGVRSSSRVTAFETTARNGTARVSAAARAIVAAQKNASGLAKVSASGRLIASGRVEVIQFAIAQSAGSISLVSAAAGVDVITTQRNDATITLGPQHSQSIALGPTRDGTISLNPSE